MLTQQRVSEFNSQINKWERISNSVLLKSGMTILFGLKQKQKNYDWFVKKKKLTILLVIKSDQRKLLWKCIEDDYEIK